MEAHALDRCVAEVHSEAVNTTYRIGLDGQDKGTVLAVEDEQSIGLSLRLILSRFCLVFIQAPLSEEGVSILRNALFDAALLNINKPGTRGLKSAVGSANTNRIVQFSCWALRTMRVKNSRRSRRGRMTTSQSRSTTRHLSLVLTLRSAVEDCARSGTVITIGDLSLDASRRLAKKNGRPIHPTRKQFKLIHFLMTNLGKALPHAKLLMNVWGVEYGGELEYLRTYVRQLRKNIEDDPARPRYLLTESHFGYRLNELA